MLVEYFRCFDLLDLQHGAELGELVEELMVGGWGEYVLYYRLYTRVRDHSNSPYCSQHLPWGEDQDQCFSVFTTSGLEVTVPEQQLKETYFLQPLHCTVREGINEAAAPQVRVVFAA